jgi:hypothetical protein
MPRSKKEKPIRSPRNIQMSVSISRELQAAARGRAQSLDRSLSSYIRRLLEKDLAAAGIAFPKTNHDAPYNLNERATEEP